MIKFFLLLVFAIFASGCSSVFYQPDRFVYYPPELNGFQQKNIYFNSRDGSRIHAWYFEAKKPKGTIIQFHGNAENLSSHYLSLVWLVEQGYNLFTFDYRDYGESMASEDATQETVYQDGLAALDKAWELHQQSTAKTFVVYGQSLGGAVSMRCFQDFTHRDETSLLVMDSTFMSYKDVARQMLAKSWISWIFSPLGSLLVSDAYSSRQTVESLKTRLLVIHDKKDPVVNFENGQEIFDLAHSQKDFWQLNAGRHIGTFTEDAQERRKQFVTLLESLNSDKNLLPIHSKTN